MKKILVLFLSVFFAFSLSAQDTVHAKLQETSPKFMLSGFGGIMSETSILKKNISESLGACGALMINNYFFIGGYGTTLITNHTLRNLIIPDEYVLDGRPMYYYGKPLRTNFSHAGIWIGGVFFSKKIIHMGLSARFGWGNIHLSDSVNNSYINNVDYRLDYTNDKIFVISPQVELDIKITSWLKFNMGIGYRFVTGIDFDRYKEYNFNAPHITVGIYIGGFANSQEDGDLPDDETPEE